MTPSPRAYYNEHDPFAAAWLCELIARGHLPSGDVDVRSIEDVRPIDLADYTACHFFAGIGGWAYALLLAGWPPHRHVWTGSCPCQPFSSAGTGRGFTDERHLWPYWYHLISECRPPVLFGEQSDAAIRHGWVDLVRTDLEAVDYAFGVVDLPAACVEAPQLRQRVWFVAESQGEQRDRSGDARRGRRELADDSRCGCWDRNAFHRTVGMYPDEVCVNKGNRVGVLADPACGGQRINGRASGDPRHLDEHVQRAANPTVGERLGHPQSPDGKVSILSGGSQQTHPQLRGSSGSSYWANCDWLPCTDGCARPVEPGTFPLAHGVPSRVGRLRGYGNAIVPQVAAEVIKAYVEVRL